jgi:hypothetical protein
MMMGVCQFLGVVRKPGCLEGESPEKQRLARMLAPSPARSPHTVVPVAPEDFQVCVMRALTKMYVELSKGYVLNWNIGLGSLRIVDKAYFDPYNALALTFEFLDVLFQGCSAKYKAGYFKTLPGKFCIVSIFTLAVKFCKSDALRPAWDRNGVNGSMELIYNCMFGHYQPQYGLQTSLRDLLFEAEVYVLSKMGGRLYALSYTHASFKIEKALEISLSTARDQERKVLLFARSVAVVYALSMHCVDDRAGDSTETDGLKQVDTQTQVALFIACQSLLSCGVVLPDTLEPWVSSTPVVQLAAVRLLKYCLARPESVLLVQESVRDLECGRFFDVVTQQRVIERSM